MKSAQKLVQSFNPKLKIINLALLIGVLSFVCTLHLSEAKAQSSRGFTVSPPSLKFSLKPGQKIERSIKITNNTKTKLEFTANAEDFVVTNKEGTPELLPPGTLPNNRYAASTWSAVIPDTFTIEPGKFFMTTLYIQVPGNASPGGHYFAATFKPVGEGALTTSGASINTVIGSLVYLTVEGKVKESARIISFFTKPLSEFGPIPFTTEIHNFGDIHVSPKASVEVKDLFGRKAFSFALDNLNIFPGVSRIYKNSWEVKWLFGRYVADLKGYYGAGNKFPLAASLVFWVIPYKLIVAVLLAVTIIVVAYYMIKKKQEPPEEIVEE